MLSCSRHWILKAVSLSDKMNRLGSQENEDAVYFLIEIVPFIWAMTKSM